MTQRIPPAFIASMAFAGFTYQALFNQCHFSIAEVTPRAFVQFTKFKIPNRHSHEAQYFDAMRLQDAANMSIATLI